MMKPGSIHSMYMHMLIHEHIHTFHFEVSLCQRNLFQRNHVSSKAFSMSHRESTVGGVGVAMNVNRTLTRMNVTITCAVQETSRRS